MVTWQWAVERLEAARNYWLATTKVDGAPHVMPVWGLWLDGAVLFSTSPESIKARNFARDPRAVLHVADGEESDPRRGRGTRRARRRHGRSLRGEVRLQARAARLGG